MSRCKGRKKVRKEVEEVLCHGGGGVEFHSSNEEVIAKEMEGSWLPSLKLKVELQRHLFACRRVMKGMSHKILHSLHVL